MEYAVAVHEVIDIAVNLCDVVFVEGHAEHVAEFGHSAGMEQLVVQYQFAPHAEDHLLQAVLETHQFRRPAGDVQAFAELFLDDVLHIALVDDGAVVMYHPVVEEHLGAVAVDVAHKEVVGNGIAGAVGNALSHALGGTVGESEAEHVAVLHAALMRMHHTLCQDVGLAASRRRQHQVPPTADGDGLLLPRVEGSFLHHVLFRVI